MIEIFESLWVFMDIKFHKLPSYCSLLIALLSSLYYLKFNIMHSRINKRRDNHRNGDV